MIGVPTYKFETLGLGQGHVSRVVSAKVQGGGDFPCSLREVQIHGNEGETGKTS